MSENQNGGRLQGKAALVTGGASGLGLAVVNAFLAEGSRVAVMDRSQEHIDALTERHSEVVATVADVREPRDHERAVDAAVEAFGGLDVYVGNAGIWDYGRALSRFALDDLAETFDELMGVNVKGYLLGARAALPHLVRSRGSIIFTLSNAAFHADGGGPLYTASKHAALGLVRQLAFEFAPYVRVNGVAPGAIHTDLRGPESLGMADRAISSLPIESGLAGKLPIDQWAEPSDYAPAFVYLAAAAESGFATGSVINVDGGFDARGLVSARGGDGLAEWAELQN